MCEVAKQAGMNMTGTIDLKPGTVTCRSIHVRVSIALFVSHSTWHHYPAIGCFKEYSKESIFSDRDSFYGAQSPE
jgi:hypothetical protein